MEPFRERLSNQNRENNRGIGVYFDGFRRHSDFTPRYSFIRSSAGIGPVELLTGINVYGVIGSVALFNENGLIQPPGTFHDRSQIPTNHQICITDVVLDHPTTQDDDTGLLRKDGFIVYCSDVASNVNDQTGVFVGVEVDHVS